MQLRSMFPATLAAGLLAIPAPAIIADEPVSQPPNGKRGAPAKACYPDHARRQNLEGSVTVMVIHSASGELTDVQIPPGTPEWLAGAARCVVAQLPFKPERINGVPVETRIAVPVNFGLTDTREKKPARLESPVLRSTPAELEAASRQCFPPGLEGGAVISYRIEIEVDGRVGQTKVIESSGDRRLDKAGACIVKKLRFSPALRGGKAVKTTTIWKLLVKRPTS